MYLLIEINTKKHVNLNEEKEEIIFERLKYTYIKNLLKGKQIDDD